MASSLGTPFFYCDKTLACTKTFSLEEMRTFHKLPCCLRASSRHGHSAECIAAMVGWQRKGMTVRHLISYPGRLSGQNGLTA
jgi:hypothetical protein